MIWYTQTREQLYKQLQTNWEGLGDDEAARRLHEYGTNELTLKRKSLWKIIAEPFIDVFIAVLLVAALVSLLSHEALDSGIIVAIIIVNALIFYTQQYATYRVLRSLKRNSVQTIRVRREGTLQTISSLNLVPGDVIVLSEGERIPADVRVIEAEHLQLNESSLTGESLPITKHASTITSEKPLYARSNMLYQGTYVVTGTGEALVVETGARTEFGRIATLASHPENVSPVRQKIDTLISTMVKVLAVVAAVVFILALARGIPASEALRFVLSLTVSAVPEGLPVALTVILVLGMRRMARQKALVRSMKAIEDIGLVTTIATDKTGTLTKNHLTVVDTWSHDRANVNAAIAYAIDANETQVDPLDKALAEYVGVGKKTSLKKFYPFDQSLRMSGAYHQNNHGNYLYVKGAPEYVLKAAKLAGPHKAEAENVLHAFTAKGYRVIALARQSHPAAPKKLADAAHHIEFLGFVACADELRPEAAAAIAEAQSAGIQVKLITGDHFDTAFHIGQQVGLAEHRDDVIEGHDLPKRAAALAEVTSHKSVFARILPEDKFRILQALKTTEITAMTGDGVNDVPALANAHVGIAMGSGSDIAKDAGGIVLLDDNFATIIKAVAEGRKIFDNIRRMLLYLLSTSLGEVMTMIGALLFALPLPATAIQILWINLVTETLLVIPLGLEPAEAGVMKRGPRRPTAPLLSPVLVTRLLLVAGAMAVSTLTIVAILSEQGYSVQHIQTIAFMGLVAAPWANAFNARSEYESIFTRLRQPNPSFWVGLGVAIALQALVMFGPLGPVFDIQDVPLVTLACCVLGIALAVIAVVEIHKFIIRWQTSTEKPQL